MGRSRKNNRRSIRKVSRKPRNHSKFVKPNFSSEAVAAQWNPYETAKQNFKRLGVSLHMQDRQQLSAINKAAGGGSKGSVELEYVDMEDLHNLRSQPRNHRKKPNYVTEEETRYLEPLIEKHGTDYTAMFRDTKLNDMQHTAAHLRRRCQRLALYKKYLAEQAASVAEAGAQLAAQRKRGKRPPSDDDDDEDEEDSD